MDGQNGGQGGQKSLKMTAIDLFQVHRAHLRQDALPPQLLRGERFQRFRLAASVLCCLYRPRQDQRECLDRGGPGSLSIARFG